MTKIDTKKLRQAQKDWLDDIEARFGDNFVQMTEACNLLAEKSNTKPVGSETLRQFYHKNISGANVARTLSDRVVLLLYKAYGIEPKFATDLLYDMEKDTAQISQHAKFCKQFIADISLAKGIYRMDVGRNVGMHETTISRLFNDKLPKGLQMKQIEKLSEHYGINIPPRFRAFLEQKKGAAEGVPIIGYFSLKNGQVLEYAEKDWRYIDAPPGLDVKNGRAIEMKGPTAHPLAKDGMVAFFNQSKVTIPDECLDATCFVTLADGRSSLRLVEPSAQRGKYRLHSLLDGSVEELAIKMAAKLEFLIQR